MKVKSKYWLEDDSGEVVFGEGRRKMLELIDELGSMQASAKALGMSYRGVWARIKATEERLGVKLVETSVGRGKNRGSRLTAEARKLLRDFKILTQKGHSYSDALFDSIFQDGESDITPVVPVLAVIGPAKSGKTALISRLAAEWSRRGRKVGVIQMLEEIAPEPSTGLPPAEAVLETGIKPLVSAGPGHLVIRMPEAGDMDPEAIAANFALGADLMLMESRQRLHLPSIEIFRQDMGGNPITRRRRDIVAVVGDQPPNKKDWPCFQPDDLAGLIGLVEETVLKRAEKQVRIKLVVDGRRVPMLPFVMDIFENAVTGMVTSLKSCETPREIDLIIRRS